ncbi:MAG: uncharacterized protein A8A55_2718 [Amphiamblys sp. WSBS2006]|nr:MAG: uncharacterized protein A8A55_2718 [Amphiamblys sp. WSBS2006]
MHGEEGNKWGLKIPYGISLFVTKENSCCLELFDLTKTKIKKLTVTSFDITKMNLKNTTIEELFLVDEMAFNFFYNTIVRSVFCVEKFSFGGKSNLQSEKVLKLVERVHEGENLTQGKIKTLALNKNNFFDFLEKASRTGQKEIHVEDLAVIQKAGKKRPEIETSTRFFVSKKISIRGNARVLLFVVLGPELNHLDIGESEKQCRSLIDIPRIWFVLTKNGIVIKENVYPFNFLKKNITATEVSFFTTSRKDALEKNKIKLVSEELENISFKYKGLSALLAITNRKIKVRHMAVLDTDICFSRQEKEEIIGKTFVIREKLYMKNTGVFFVELLGNTVFIPVIEIEIDCCTEDWRGFKKTNDIRVETNALLKSIKTQIKGARYIEKAIQQVIAQKETVVENNSGYPKLVFEEDNNHEEQNEQGESEEQSAAECQIHEVFKEYLKHKEQHGPGESSEQPRIEKQEFVEDNYTLSEGELEKYIPKDLFFSEED